MKPLWRIFRREKAAGEAVGRLVDVAQIRGDLPAIRRAVADCNDMTGPDSLFGASLRIAHFAFPVREAAE